MTMLETPGSANEAYEKSVQTPEHTAKHKRAASRHCCSPHTVAVMLMVTGALLVVASVLYGTVLPAVIDRKIKTGGVVCSLADTTESYFDPYGDCDDCTPYYYALHLFNVTNAADHLHSNAKLQLTESGAYVYRRRQIKVDVAFDNNHRVSYRQYTYHTFEPTLSCSGCKDTDVYTGLDVAYLSVLAAAGGEAGFLTDFVNRTVFGSGKNPFQLDAIVRNNGTKLLQWLNGLNSLDSDAMQTASADGLVLQVLLTGPQALANVTTDGFANNGLFVRRTVAQWALGYPSLLAGLAYGAMYKGNCTTGPNVLKQCATCSGDTCDAIAAACQQCQRAAAVVAVNNITCSAVEQVVAQQFGSAAGRAFGAATCRLCTSLGLCAAPLPGIVETSGMDWSKTSPPTALLTQYIQRTGCDDRSVIGEYELFDGEAATPLWTPLDARRNPTLAELAAFQQTAGTCSRQPTANKSANVTCSAVRGTDGQSFVPGGASISGFAPSAAQTHAELYLSQGKQAIAVYDTNRTVEYNGVALHRFAPATDLLNATAANAALGTGVPVDGVQPIGYTTGFLAFVSFPLFLYGDNALLHGVTITLHDGVTIATFATLYDSNSNRNSTGSRLKDEFDELYMTFLDVEAGTGKTMRARKRLQASYALSRSARNTTRAMTDVLWPDLPVHVIVPAYWAEERATIRETQLGKYKAVASLLRTMLPTLIAGSIAGLALAALGCLRHGRGVASDNDVHTTVM